MVYLCQYLTDFQIFSLLSAQPLQQRTNKRQSRSQSAASRQKQPPLQSQTLASHFDSIYKFCCETIV